ncbi:MAG: arginine--tRNA ligase [Eubacteriales bacterium]|nr:arginine--tRNA ligase [Eubacteriales bacterium]
MELRNKTLEFLANHLRLETAEMADILEIPPRPELGDLSMPCFKFAKIMRKAPQAIAKEWAALLDGQADFLERVTAEGPYLNFYYRRSYFAENIFARAEAQPDKLISFEPIEPEGTILVEYSSPNIAKPFHVGHGFSTCLGDALAKMFSYRGYDVKRLNHFGDYGTQFGRLIYAWQHWGDEKALAEQPIKELTRVYVKFHEVAEEDESLYDAARKHFSRLEQGKEPELSLWEHFREMSLVEFQRIYERLDISFDSLNGEAFYSDMIPEVLDMLKQKGLLEESEGAEVVDLSEFDLNPCIMVKSDGSSIYATRDLAAVIYRDRTWDFYRNMYVVGREQAYHFKQIFAVLKRMGHPKADQCYHVAFGRISSGTEEFSTRHGKIILLEDFLDATYKKVLEIMSEGNFDMPESEREATAEAIAVASVKFFYLKSGREKDISFTWEDILDFNGDTAPYILYTYARARSILRKASDLDFSQAKVELLVSDAEFNLLKDLADLEPALEEALKLYEPSVLVRQILKLVKNFNRFYRESPIMKEEDADLRLARLALCELYTKELKLALSLLGIQVVERM